MGHRATYGALWVSLWDTGPSMGHRAIYRALYGAQGIYGALQMALYVAQGPLCGSLRGSLCGKGPSLWLSMGTGPSIGLSMGQRSIYGAQDHLWGPPHLGLELPLAVGQQIWGTGPSMGLSMGHRPNTGGLYVTLCGT